MYPLFESIKIVDGQFVNLEWHQRRVDKSRLELFGGNKPLDLDAELEIPNEHSKGVVKCRVSYGKTMGPVDFASYFKREMKALQLVNCTPFDYSLKYEDRSKLERLYQLRGNCDEVLIAINGLITDTSYSNVVFFDGSQWLTPQKPLLKGTQRACLLSAGIIKEKNINVSDLPGFAKLVLINAMLEFEPNEFITSDKIKFWDRPPVVF